MIKLKACADGKLNVAKMKTAIFDSRKHCGKRRKWKLPAFSPSPTVFFKAFSRVIKSRNSVVERVKKLSRKQSEKEEKKKLNQNEDATMNVSEI